MSWTQIKPGLWKQDSRYIALVRVGGVERYSVWRVVMSQEDLNRMTKAVYQIGERVPQRWEHLGVFPTLESAQRGHVADVYLNGLVKGAVW